MNAASCIIGSDGGGNVHIVMDVLCRNAREGCRQILSKLQGILSPRYKTRMMFRPQGGMDDWHG